MSMIPFVVLENEKLRTKNQNELDSLQRHSEELSALYSEVMSSWHADLKDIPVDKRNYLEYKSQENAIKGLEQLKEKLSTLEQVRLLDLCGSNLPIPTFAPRTSTSSEGQRESMLTIPEAMVRLVLEKSWEGRGETIVHELKDLIINNQLFFVFRDPQHEWTVLSWWKYALKMIDLLFMNGFVKQNTIQEFFQDSNVIKQFIRYIELRIEADAENSLEYLKERRDLSYRGLFLSTSPKLHTHWYWSLWHDCLKALGKKEETLLRGHTLLQVRYRKLLKLIERELPNTVWHDFFARRFAPSKYLEHLRSADKALPSETKDMINGDLHTIIQLQTDPGSRFKDSFAQDLYLHYLSDIVELFEECLAPGALQENLLQIENA